MSEMLFKFSIVIPVYNVAPYLRECLDSVLAQTFIDWEAICVDDGSTDGSGAILDEYREKVEEGRCGGGQRTGRFVVIHQKNAGVSAARNAALDVANGEWVLFLDGDDVLSNTALEKLSQAIERENPELIHFSWMDFQDKDGEVKADMPLVEHQWSKTEFRNGVLPACVYSWCFPSFAYRRNLCGKMRFVTGMIYGEDRIYASQALAQVHAVLNIPDILYFCRIRKGSASHSLYTPQKLIDDLRHLVIYCENLERVGMVLERRDGVKLGKRLTEQSFYSICHDYPQDKRALLDAWRAIVRKGASLHSLPYVRRVMMRGVLADGSNLLAGLLFYFPNWLKLKGFRR